MKRCCDNCAHLMKTPEGFFCGVKKRKITILYKYNVCTRFKGVSLYERD